MLLAAFVSVMIFGSGLIRTDGFSGPRPGFLLAPSSLQRQGTMARQIPLVSLPDGRKYQHRLNRLSATPSRHFSGNEKLEKTGISSAMLAEAAQKSYQPAGFSGFQVRERFDHPDLRFVVFENVSSRQIIVAFPGTQTLGELLTDIAMVAGDEPVNKLLDRGLTDLGIIEKMFMDSVVCCRKLFSR